ncbi:uncharacterized protein LOC112464562, partial [Temnothorax curvispinosus]|uniref:Uncharacterized protein LOC112464562 n=1 Tax=Temnothorax curvispinosus TaxID=300111 RepID=A0A6J1R2S2_9HYME
HNREGFRLRVVDATKLAQRRKHKRSNQFLDVETVFFLLLESVQLLQLPSAAANAALIPRHQAFSSMMEDKLNQLNMNDDESTSDVDVNMENKDKDKEEMKRLQKENAKLRRQLAAIKSPSPLSELLVRNAQAPSTTPAPPAAPTPAQLPATPATSRNSCLPPEK